LEATTAGLYATPDFKDVPRKVEPKEWIDRSFVVAALHALGPAK
jgi:hypothetical protein